MRAARVLGPWAVTTAVVMGIAATASLGAWQLGRAKEKLERQAAIEATEALPPLDGSALRKADAQALMHRAVVLRGAWDSRHTIFLDNRQMRGTPGFYVVTPLQLEGGGAVVVERGWVPRDFRQRENLPMVQTPQGTIEVRGRVAPPPARLYQLGDAGSGTIRQNLELEAFRAETGLPLSNVAVRQLGADSEGLLREWPQAGTGSQKNYGYAFQWWAISAVIAILYVWFQFIAPRRKARPA